MRLIDADRLKVEINELMILYRKKTIDSVGVEEAVPFIEAMHIAKNVELVVDGQPTVEMRPKGKWVKETELVGGHYHEMLICSSCKWTTDRLPYGMIPYGINFCLNCGADMRG